jgi:putative transposase
MRNTKEPERYSRYKSIIIKNEAHFIHLPYYIHLNPLDLISTGWRERKLTSHKEAWKFLENYRWSSHLDYLGKKNFPSVTQREFLLEFFGGSEKYKKSISGWLKNLDIENFKDFALD